MLVHREGSCKTCISCLSLQAQAQCQALPVAQGLSCQIAHTSIIVTGKPSSLPSLVQTVTGYLIAADMCVVALLLPYFVGLADVPITTPFLCCPSTAGLFLMCYTC